MVTRGGPDGGEVLRLADLDPRERARLVRRTVFRSVAVAVALVAGHYVLPDSVGGESRVVIRLVGGIVLLVVVVAWQLRVVARARHPQLRVVEALALALALVVVVFAVSYRSLSVNDAAAFDEPLGHTDALYFTLTTVTTVGFGDIAAESEAARIMVMTQMVADFVLVGVGIRLLAHAAKTRLETGSATSS